MDGLHGRRQLGRVVGVDLAGESHRPVEHVAVTRHEPGLLDAGARAGPGGAARAADIGTAKPAGADVVEPAAFLLGADGGAARAPLRGHHLVLEVLEDAVDALSQVGAEVEQGPAGGVVDAEPAQRRLPVIAAAAAEAGAPGQVQPPVVLAPVVLAAPLGIGEALVGGRRPPFLGAPQVGQAALVRPALGGGVAAGRLGLDSLGLAGPGAGLRG